LGVKEDGIIGPGTLAVWKKYNPLVTERLRLTNVAALQAQITAIQLRKTFL
jgi:lysozyme family protein